MPFRWLVPVILAACWLGHPSVLLSQPPRFIGTTPWLVGQTADTKKKGDAVEPVGWWEPAPRPDRAFASPRRSPRFQLFGMPPGFLCDPLGLESSGDLQPDDDPFLQDNAAASFTFPAMRFSMGEDNLYFAPGRRGDAGGAGFRKVQSLLQLVDAESISLCLGLQAVMPASPEEGGLSHGPTTFHPSLAWFHEMGEGAALHGFVGKQIQTNFRQQERLDTDLQCGLAVQYPLLGLEKTNDPAVFVFLQALGRINNDYDLAKGKWLSWELVPGIHWRVNEHCWLSMGASRFSLVTCSWKY